MMNTESRREVPVWDPAVRPFHWSLAGAFLVAYVTEDEWEMLHVNAGYLIGALIVLRLGGRALSRSELSILQDTAR